MEFQCKLNSNGFEEAVCAEYSRSRDVSSVVYFIIPIELDLM